MEVESLHTAAAAFALAVLVHRHHDHRPAGALHQPGGHDANDAGMPVAAPQQHHAVFQPFRLLFQKLLRRIEDLQLDLLTPGVDLVQFAGQLLGTVGILAEHQLQGGHGAVHTARRVDARRNGIADILRRDRLARKAHLFQQGFQPRTVGVLQLMQAGSYQCAVLADQRHHIRHRAHSGKVAAVIQHFLRRAAVQRGAQLKGHARTAQALERAGIIPAAGVHHSSRLGQCIRRQMVVGNDQVDAQFCSVIRFVHGRNAIVHGHDQLTALVVDGADRVFGKAVTVPLSAGQHTLDGRSHALEMLVQKGRSGHAVHIVVAEDHDGLAIVDGLPDALTGLVHVGQQRRVAQFFFARQQGQRFGGVGDAPRGQHTGQQGVFLLLGGQHLMIFCFRPRLFVHGLLFQFFCGLFRDGPGQLLQHGAVQRFQFPCTVGH